MTAALKMVWPFPGTLLKLAPVSCHRSSLRAAGARCVAALMCCDGWWWLCALKDTAVTRCTAQLQAGHSGGRPESLCVGSGG